ncbi:hypothetical protein [Halorubrum coriense]|nr:hypothetical protein [Halorubrum coriense]
MSDSPRRVRARGWAWACLALSEPDGERVDDRGDEPSDDAATDSE